jgi:hypothetical protein
LINQTLIHTLGDDGEGCFFGVMRPQAPTAAHRVAVAAGMARRRQSALMGAARGRTGWAGSMRARVVANDGFRHFRQVLPGRDIDTGGPTSIDQYYDPESIDNIDAAAMSKQCDCNSFPKFAYILVLHRWEKIRRSALGGDMRLNIDLNSTDLNKNMEITSI